MGTKPETIPEGRVVLIDGNGHLHTAEGTLLDVIADPLYAVVVLWDLEERLTWVGWLTTTTRRTACFSAADLEDPIFQSWLRALPGWDDAKLWRATSRPDLHLVWRRRVTIEISRP